MKKWIPALLSIAIMACSVPTVVIAESGNNQTTNEIVTTTSPTEVNTTTKKAGYNFSFTSNGDSITVNWNAGDNPGIYVKSVKIGSQPSIEVNDNTGSFTVNISNLNPGFYTLSYTMSDGKTIIADTKIERGGDSTTNMTLKIVNSHIEATLTDSNGQPVANYPIRLFLDGEEAAGGKTNTSGIFTANVPSSFSEIKCVAEDSTVGSVNYIGCQKILTSGGGITATSQGQETTATKVQSTTPTVKNSNADSKSAETIASTYAIINGNGTTSVDGDNIAVNVSFDTQVAKNFDYSNTEFEARSRLIVSKDTYSSLVGDSASMLMMLAKTPAKSLTQQNISSAINGKSKYSTFNPEDTEIIPLDLSLINVDSSHNVNSQVTLPSTEVTVVLPIPKSMKDTSQYEVVAAVYDDNGITKLIDTEEKDGSISFKTDQLTTIAILGFKSPANLNKGPGIPTQSIIMITAGILLLGGAITLLYFFFLRKPLPAPDTGLDDTMVIDSNDEYSDVSANYDNPEPAPEFEPESESEQESAPDQTDEYPEDNGIDIYSGAPIKERPLSHETQRTDDVTDISLGSISGQKQNKPKTKNPSDYNIDL